MKGSFKFIHCADLHLGCRFVGVSSTDEAVGKKLRESHFKALDKIIQTAKKNNVDFIIFSGDIFDDENETPSARSRFADALEKAKVKCFIIYGNHDYKRKWEDSIPFPENAFVFPDKVTRVAFPDEDDKVADIFGISYSSKHVSSDLTGDIRGDGKTFSIGIVHTSLDIVSDDHDYAPCKVSDLMKKNIDYWALGHIHKRTIVKEYPHIVYPGNTQGKGLKETGEKGAYIVTVTDGRVTDMEFFRTGEVIWCDTEADITDKKDIREVIRQISDDVKEKGSFVRVNIVGHGPLDRMARVDPDGLKELIQSSTGFIVADLSVNTLPEIDLNERKEANDFTSAVISFGQRLETADRKSILDIICSTTTSANIRPQCEKMSDDELRSIVRDSMLMIIEKIMTEASR